MIKSYEDLKLELVLGFKQPNDVIQGTKLKYDNIMNPNQFFETSNICRFVLFDSVDNKFLTEIEIEVNGSNLSIRSRDLLTDKFIKYNLTKEEALKRFLAIKNSKGLRSKRWENIL